MESLIPQTSFGQLGHRSKSNPACSVRDSFVQGLNDKETSRLPGPWADVARAAGEVLHPKECYLVIALSSSGTLLSLFLLPVSGGPSEFIPEDLNKGIKIKTKAEVPVGMY